MNSEQAVKEDTTPAMLLRIRRHAVGIGGLAVAAAVMAIVGGLRGAIVGGLTFGVGLVVPAPMAFGVGVAGLLAIDEVSLPAAALAGVGLVAVFIDQIGETTTRNLLITVAIIGVILSSATAWGLSEWSLQAVVLGVAGSIAGGIYVIHRYERVTLGLVSQ